MEHNVLLSLAANIQHESNMAEARRRLGTLIGSLDFTDELWTEPVGKTRQPWPYLNQLAKGTTTLGAEELQQQLKQMETDMGRTPEARQMGIVPIDLDLLQYDDRRYHQRDWERDYVVRLMKLKDVKTK